MSRSLGVLTLDLVAKVGGFVAGMDRAGRTARRTAGDMRKSFNDVAKKMTFAFSAAASAAVGGIALIVNSQRDLIDQNAKLAISLNTTYAGLAATQIAAEFSGVSISSLEQAAKDLTRRLSQVAATGAGPAAEALDRLKLSATELQKLPLDTRISTINKAISDFIPIAEQAAVAGALFGEEGSLAILRISPETIEEAARQAEVFGLNLSEIDAEKVQQANDAFSSFGKMTDGLGKQLTVQLAPAIRAIGIAFLDSAEGAGGLDTAVGDFVDTSVRKLKFVIDAVDGLRRVWLIVGNSIAIAIMSASLELTKFFAQIAELTKKIPGVGDQFASVIDGSSIVALTGGIAAAKAALKDALETPLAGNAFVEAWEQAKIESKNAAIAAVELRKRLQETGAEWDGVGESAEGANKKTASSARAARDVVGDTLKQLERSVAVWGMTTREVALFDLAMKGATGEQIKYADSLLSTVEGFEAAKKAREDYQRAIEADMQAVQGVVDHLKSEEEKLAESYENRRKIILDSIALAENEKTALLLQLEEERAEALMAAEEQRASAMRMTYSTLFGDLAAMSAAFAGEQSALTKTMFAVSKAFAIADAIVKIQQGIASAAALPFPANIPAMAGVASATAGIVSTIQGTQLTGMAHDGIDAVPKTGTWLLEKGERVLTNETSAKLDAMLDGVRNGQRITNNRNSRIEQTINVTGRVDRRTAAQIATEAARKQRTAAARYA